MEKPGHNPRRIILGVLGATMLTVAMYTYFITGYTQDNAFFTGVFSKVGIVLLTIFLAWPILENSIDRAPMLVNGLGLAAVIFLAIRPRLLPLLIALVAIFLVVHFGLRFASERLKNR